MLRLVGRACQQFFECDVVVRHSSSGQKGKSTYLLIFRISHEMNGEIRKGGKNNLHSLILSYKSHQAAPPSLVPVKKIPS